jgi:HK97 gp10 family phage protein
MKIKFEGLEAIITDLEEITDIETLERALGRACAKVERTAKEKAPKGDGTLRRSITSRVTNNEGIVFTNLEYAPYVEFGTGLFAEGGNGRKDVPWHYQDEEENWHTTSGMKPQPYLRPALLENREEILKILKEGLLND